MVKAPSKIIAVVVIIFGLIAMVMLNSASQKFRPKSHEEIEAEEQEAAQKSQAANPPPAPVQTPTGEASAGGLSTLGQDAMLGATSPSAPEVTLRWSWTPQVQGDPQKVYAAIEDLKKKMPDVRIHVVNTDEDSTGGDGVFVGNRLVTPAKADGAIPFDQNAVSSALHRK